MALSRIGELYAVPLNTNCVLKLSKFSLAKESFPLLYFIVLCLFCVTIILTPNLSQSRKKLQNKCDSKLRILFTRIFCRILSVKNLLR